ncbi:hypothetical protein BJY52DRAFT_1242569 [Lactarius psammicola]|nr:hypothetical protein BJY52DRAFT_1242569 [Lactarius psammicola]
MRCFIIYMHTLLLSVTRVALRKVVSAEGGCRLSVGDRLILALAFAWGDLTNGGPLVGLSFVEKGSLSFCRKLSLTDSMVPVHEGLSPDPLGLPTVRKQARSVQITLRVQVRDLRVLDKR